MATKEKEPSSTETAEQSPNSPSATKRKASAEEIEVDLEAPEPPSKRARRALKKGKVLPKKPSSDDDDEDLTKDGAVDDDNKKPRGEHGVWIGNLPFTATAPVLKTWLVDNSGGSITDEGITRIKLPKSKDPSREKDAKPANKGFAYVDFADISGKVAAIALSESAMGGRRVLIKDSKSFEGRPKKEAEPGAETADGATGEGLQQQKAAFKKEMDASRKIFVGNMSFKTTEDDVWRNFEKCGEIEFVKVATFEDTGKCKGFGWVRFKNPEAAAWAVKGFVKLKEQVETEEDFKKSDDEDAGSDGGERQKQFKTRKWWVNRMLGRELKIELAEDDKSRYQKRFGKGAQNKGDRPDGKRNNRQDGENGGNEAATEPRPLQEATDIQVARLTGAVVKSTGTKVTFDS